MSAASRSGWARARPTGPREWYAALLGRPPDLEPADAVYEWRLRPGAVAPARRRRAAVARHRRHAAFRGRRHRGGAGALRGRRRARGRADDDPRRRLVLRRRRPVRQRAVALRGPERLTRRRGGGKVARHRVERLGDHLGGVVDLLARDDERRRERHAVADRADEDAPGPRLGEDALRQVGVGGELVRRERDSAERAEAGADVADQVAALEAVQRARDLALELHAALQQVLAAHDVEVRHRRRAARRVRAVRRAVAEHRAAGLPERLGDAAGDDDPAERQVAARHALREADHVRPHAEALGGEPGAEAAEGVDHGVDDEDDAGALAELGDALDVARRRLVDTARAHDGLDEDRGHPVGADALDLGLERLERVVRDERGVRVERPHVDTVGGDAADARAEAVRAVVALRAADEVHALRRADRGEVAAGQLAGGVDRVAAARAEEDPRVVDRRQLAEALGQPQRRRVRERAERGVAREGAHLRGGGVDDLLAAVADVDVPQARGAVEVAPAVGVPDVRALAARDDDLGAADGVHVGEGVPEAGGGGGPPPRNPPRPPWSRLGPGAGVSFRAAGGPRRWGALPSPPPPP